MISVKESNGKMPATRKDSLTNLKPKENRDPRKARSRREAREATQAQARPESGQHLSQGIACFSRHPVRLPPCRICVSSTH